MYFSFCRLPKTASDFAASLFWKGEHDIYTR